MGWPKHAYVGQKVVVIKEPNDVDRSILSKIPPRDTTLTISWVGICEFGVLIDLIEYPQSSHMAQYRGYFASAFRPLEERKTDISIFTAMLGPRQKETLDA